MSEGPGRALQPAIVVDIGATKTVIAYFSDDNVTPLDRFPTPEQGGEAVGAIAASLESHRGGLGRIERIGVGAPGPLDAARGVILSPPNLPGWRDYPLVAELQRRTDLPARLENDANLGALGEAIFGSGRSHFSVFYLTISTGVGAGLVIDGEIFGGYRGMAGEVHAIDPQTYFGCESGYDLNDRASGAGMVRSAKRLIDEGASTKLESTGLDTYRLLAALEQGDPVAVETVEGARNAVAGLLINVLAILAPAVVVLAGGLCTDNRWIVDPVRERVHRWMRLPELAEIPIERAALWDKAVLYGAAAL